MLHVLPACDKTSPFCVHLSHNIQNNRFVAPVLVLLRSYDSRVKAMEVDEKPKEEYTDVGGLDKQIEVWGHVAVALQLFTA